MNKASRITCKVSMQSIAYHIVQKCSILVNYTQFRKYYISIQLSIIYVYKFSKLFPINSTIDLDNHHYLPRYNFVFHTYSKVNYMITNINIFTTFKFNFIIFKWFCYQHLVVYLFVKVLSLTL